MLLLVRGILDMNRGILKNAAEVEHIHLFSCSSCTASFGLCSMFFESQIFGFIENHCQLKAL